MNSTQIIFKLWILKNLNLFDYMIPSELIRLIILLMKQTVKFDCYSCSSILLIGTDAFVWSDTSYVTKPIKLHDKIKSASRTAFMTTVLTLAGEIQFYDGLFKLIPYDQTKLKSFIEINNLGPHKSILVYSINNIVILTACGHVISWSIHMSFECQTFCILSSSIKKIKQIDSSIYAVSTTGMIFELCNKFNSNDFLGMCKVKISKLTGKLPLDRIPSVHTTYLQNIIPHRYKIIKSDMFYLVDVNYETNKLCVIENIVSIKSCLTKLYFLTEDHVLYAYDHLTGLLKNIDLVYVLKIESNGKNILIITFDEIYTINTDESDRQRIINLV